MVKYITNKFIMGALLAAVFVAGILILKSNPADTPAKTVVQSINSSQLAGMLNNKNFTLINVHVPYEGEIAKTDAFIAYGEINENSPGLPKDKSAQIVVYCKTGRMSRIAVNKLVSLGYRSIYDLTGGMDAWRSAGYTLARSGAASSIFVAVNAVILNRAEGELVEI